MRSDMSCLGVGGLCDWNSQQSWKKGGVQKMMDMLRFRLWDYSDTSFTKVDTWSFGVEIENLILDIT
jgi:hypothetical protein